MAHELAHVAQNTADSSGGPAHRMAALMQPAPAQTDAPPAPNAPAAGGCTRSGGRGCGPRRSGHQRQSSLRAGRTSGLLLGTAARTPTRMARHRRARMPASICVLASMPRGQFASPETKTVTTISKLTRLSLLHPLFARATALAPDLQPGLIVSQKQGELAGFVGIGAMTRLDKED